MTQDRNVLRKQMSEIVKKDCQECGAEFVPQRPSQKFCSVLCYRRHTRKQMIRFHEESKVDEARP